MARNAFVVAADIKIRGTIETDRDVQVDGYLNGALICKRASISESATVLGNVVAQVVVVEGKVDGSIFADRLTLAASCKVHGDVHHRDLRLHEGCYFEGKSRHSKRPRDLARVRSVRTTRTGF